MKCCKLLDFLRNLWVDHVPECIKHYPIGSMGLGVFTYMTTIKSKPNVGKFTIHGSCEYETAVNSGTKLQIKRRVLDLLKHQLVVSYLNEPNDINDFGYVGEAPN